MEFFSNVPGVLLGLIEKLQKGVHKQPSERDKNGEHEQRLSSNQKQNDG